MTKNAKKDHKGPKKDKESEGGGNKPNKPKKDGATKPKFLKLKKSINGLSFNGNCSVLSRSIRCKHRKGHPTCPKDNLTGATGSRGLGSLS